MSSDENIIYSNTWREVPEKDNPFSAAACYCAGFDVYGDMLGKASWIEYLYLLFHQQPPSKEQKQLLEGLAVALANPGPRDNSVRAAMAAGAGGSTHASCLMAALSVGAGQYQGAREVMLMMESISKCDTDHAKWRKQLTVSYQESEHEVWPAVEHPPGFDPYGTSCATPVIQTLEYLAQYNTAGALSWLCSNRTQLETYAGIPLAMPGVAAAAFIDLGFTTSQGEMLYLLLRLPGAAAHALEQEVNGYKRYPFFKHGLSLENDPGPFMTVQVDGEERP